MSRIRISAFALLMLCGCHHRRTLPESLTIIFADHLQQIDTAAKLDSVHVRWNFPMTERLGRIIDDTIYVREYSRVKAQLAGALVGCSFFISKNKKALMDSTVEFIDTTSTVRFTDFLDSALRRSVKTM
jgi:hypothetical protein